MRSPRTAKPRRRGSQTLFEVSSPLSGRLRVVESRGTRRLVAAGQTLSAYPVSGDWSRLRREYWWRAFEGLPLPPRPRVLLVGLGGGTQIHVLRDVAAPRAVTAVERDPLIIRVARDWFGVRATDDLEVICGEAQVIVPRLIGSRRRFELVVEDATYADVTGYSLTLCRSLSRLVAPGGTLVANRHFRREAALLAAAMAPLFQDVSQLRIRRDGENVVVRCVGRSTWTPPSTAPASRARSAGAVKPR